MTHPAPPSLRSNAELRPASDAVDGDAYDMVTRMYQFLVAEQPGKAWTDDMFDRAAAHACQECR